MRIETIKSGKNNFVGKIFYKNKLCIYKKYLKNNKTGIHYSRYKSETSFLNFLRKKNIKNLPSILSSNALNQENIFNYIDGKKVNNVGKKDIQQCINFIRKINFNSSKKKFLYKQKATEACLSLKDHIDTAEKRIFMLSRFSKNYGLYKKAKLFVRNELKNSFKKRMIKINKLFSKKEILRKLKPNELILSPSDFGFHNIIKKNDKLYFFDFEYAGMDDPVKLICDYICQPDYKLNKKQINFFYTNILKLFRKKETIDKRFKAVIGIHRIKWCCIILSEMLSKQYFKRRKFAKSNIDLKKCYLKAKKYYNENIKNFN